MDIRFEPTPQRLTVRARRASTSGAPDIHPVARGLLDATTDGLEMSTTGDPSTPTLEICAWVDLPTSG